VILRGYLKGMGNTPNSGCGMIAGKIIKQSNSTQYSYSKLKMHIDFFAFGFEAPVSRNFSFTYGGEGRCIQDFGGET
jgi:hypothetical protein